MITARQFKSGFVIEMEKQLHLVLSSQHTKPGKGGAFVRVKVKDLNSGSVVDRKFRPRDSFEQMHVEEKQFQYLYKDGNNFSFMDSQTYEQVSFTGEQIGDKSKFLKEGKASIERKLKDEDEQYCIREHSDSIEYGWK